MEVGSAAEAASEATAGAGPAVEVTEVDSQVHAQEEANSRTLYVGNLSEDVSEELLLALFTPFGPVKSCKMLKPSTTTDFYAFIEFEDRAKAQLALISMAGRQILGNQVRVNWANPHHMPGTATETLHGSAGNGSSSPPHGYHSVFVGDLAPSMAEVDLRKYFTKYGTIYGCRIVRDAYTSLSKNYGFVTFGSYEAAETAIREMDGCWIGSRSIRANWAMRKPHSRFTHRPQHQHAGPSYDAVSRQAGPTNSTIFVGNLNGSSDESLRDLFSRCGPVVTTRPFPEKFYGFVTFANKQAAVRAITEMDQNFVNGGRIKVAWSKERTPHQSQPQQYTSTSNLSELPYQEYQDPANYLQQYSQTQQQYQVNQLQPAMNYMCPTPMQLQGYPLYQGCPPTDMNLNYFQYATGMAQYGYGFNGLPCATPASGTSNPIQGNSPAAIGGDNFALSPAPGPAYKSKSKRGRRTSRSR